MTPNQDDKPVLSPTEARQAERGTPVFVVLVAALILVAVGWAGVEMWGQHIDPNKSQTAAPAAGSSAGSTPQRGTVDNSANAGSPVQLAPVDKSENAQRGMKSIPAQPSRDGAQN
ncbi:hypothetical protein CPY51_27405 [Rhizobium tubonense]|uniref:Uncharacterized protein n=1 Tax=Rhizobium tubonense TaxID=484088 RepID=A0A2W4DYR4_9HYPH|nr:hypothetical protein CPY51_27405 [Rhizobium tubonense]